MSRVPGAEPLGMSLRRLRRAVGVGLLLTLGLLVVGAGSAFARSPTITVTTTGDDTGALSTSTVDSDCSPAASATVTSYTCGTLREAVDFADDNTTVSDPTIMVPAGTITLTDSYGGAYLYPTVPMTIDGAGDGSGGTVIAQATADGVVVNPPENPAAVELENVAVEGDDSPGFSSATGGIYATGPLVLDDVVVSGFHLSNGFAVTGAGIKAADGLTVTDSTVEDNTATAISGPASTSATTGVAGYGAYGGGIYVEDGTSSNVLVTITDSTITGNSVTAGAGGAVTAAGATGGAGGVAYGGGLYAVNTGSGGGSLEVQITGSTFSDNTATGGAGGAGGTGSTSASDGGAGGNAQGGAMYVATNGAALDSTTVTGNSATGGAGGAASHGYQGGAAGEPLGGAVYVDGTTSPAGSLSVTDSSFGANIAAGGTAGASGEYGGNGSTADGGAIFSSGALTVRQTTFSGDAATGVNGGAGPANGHGFPDQAQAGGIAVQGGGSLKMVNSTMFDEQATSTSGNAAGGALYLQDSGTTASLASDTLDANSVSTSGLVLGESIAAGSSAALALADTIVAGPVPSGAAACDFLAPATVSDGGHNLESDGANSCLPASDPNLGTDVTNASPGLATALGVNGATTTLASETLSLAPGSPAIGSGGACVDPLSSPAGAALTVDERGLSRPAVCDIGAFESEPVVVSGSPSVSGTPAVGSTLTCATGSVVVAGDGPLSSSGQVGAVTISYAWLRDGVAISGQTASTYGVVSADAGHGLSCMETATGAYSHAAVTSAAVSVPAAVVTTTTTTSTPSPTTSTPTSTTTTSTTSTGSVSPVPVLSKLSESHKTWRVSGRPAKGRPPVGTVFAFTSSAAARVTFTFTESLKGVRVKGRCVAVTKADHRSRSCLRTVTLGTLTVAGRSGVNRLSFAGKLGPHTLRPGHYTVTITATVSGKTSSKHTLAFTVSR